MKQCPECKQVYYDETLNYCLEDGATLISGATIGDPATAILSGEPRSEAPTRPIANISYPQDQAGPTSSAEYLVREIRRHKKGAALGFFVALLALTAIGIALYRSVRNTPLRFEKMKITRLTNIGNATWNHISPNGEYLAAAVYEGGMYRIRNWDVETKSFVDVVPPTKDELRVSSYSSDSKYIYFTRSAGGVWADLYEIAALGGTPPRKILEKSGSASRSTDGQKWAFLRPGPNPGEASLIISNADGSGERVVAVGRFSSYPPSWSPNGKILACGIVVEGLMKLVTVSVDDGTVTPITDQTWLSVNRTVWLHDGSGIVFTANDENQLPIWLISYPGGQLRQLTNDANSYGNFSLSMTADSSTIATVQIDRPTNIVVSPFKDPTNGKLIVQEVGGALNTSFSYTNWAPDGRIFFSNNAGGNSDIWVTDSDGSRRQHLISHNGYDGMPVVSPDGRYIVFVSNRSGKMNLWRSDANGGSLIQLTAGGFDLFPSFSADGQWIIYESPASSDMRKVAIQGGETVRMTERRVFYPVSSPKDGSIAGRYRKDLDSPAVLAIFPPDGGEPIKKFDIPNGILHFPQWTPDGQSIIYVLTHADESTLWSQPIDGSAPKQLADFSPEQIFSFSLSRDGKSIALSRGRFIRNVVLITDTSTE